VVSELASRLPALFAQEYPQVLTHGDLSRTNILVDEDTFEITGIIDWSLAAILPFGMELDTLYLTTTGYMNLGGWHDYACRSRLHQAFWNEFWSASGIGDDGDYDDGRRAKIRDMAEQAARIGAILRHAFQRNADGSPSETLVDDGAVTLRYLQAWLAT
jgi:aminoglycoside phosphotransferase